MGMAHSRILAEMVAATKEAAGICGVVYTQGERRKDHGSFLHQSYPSHFIDDINLTTDIAF